MKMNAKYMNEDVWKFFRKFAGWHLSTSSKINFVTDKIQGFWLNKLFRMATSRSCIERLQSICEIFFFCCIYWLKFCLQLTHEISFWEVLYRRRVPENFSKFTDKHKKQSSGGVLSKHVLKNYAKFTEIVEVSFLIKLQAANPKLSEAATGDDL